MVGVGHHGASADPYRITPPYIDETRSIPTVAFAAPPVIAAADSSVGSCAGAGGGGGGWPRNTGQGRVRVAKSSTVRASS